MSIILHQDFLGTDRHLLLRGTEIKWTLDTTADFTYGACNSSRSIEPLLELYGIDLPDLIPPRFKKAMSECGARKPLWSAVVPKRLYNRNLKDVLQKLAAAEEEIAKSEYTKVFLGSNRLFDALHHSLIDVPACKKILSTEDNHVLKSILAMSREAKCPAPIYDRVSTKTGRLTIKQGPQALTLKKEYRSIFKPKSTSSKIYEIDFASLEPRVASNIANRSPGDDVYLSFMEHAGLSITRDAAKLAVLCSLYGAGKYNLQKQLKKQGSDMTADYLIRRVKEYFSVNDLLSSLRQQVKLTGKIENYFGRPIVVDDARDSVLVNNFLQSTAVDISLLGFADFCEVMKDKLTPLFVIHDALFFEAKDEYIKDIKEYLVDGFCHTRLGRFPLTITEFKT